MEWLIVRFPRTRDVFIDERRVGETNKLLTTHEGPQVIRLDRATPYTPKARRVTITASAADDPAVVTFTPA